MRQPFLYLSPPSSLRYCKVGFPVTWATATPGSFSRIASKCSGPIKLFIDGDSHSRNTVVDALQEMKKLTPSLRTHFFAAPDRTKNKQYSSLFRQEQISFHGIDRNAWGSADPNDKAIGIEIDKVLSCRESKILALLTADTGFTRFVQKILESGKYCIVIIPKGSPGSVKTYSDLGAHVIRLDIKHEVPKMKVVLSEDRVAQFEPLRETIQEIPLSDQELVKGIVRGHGFTTDTAGPLTHGPALVRFWVANRLGSLTVYPWEVAWKDAATALLEDPRRSWRKCCGNLAYLVPICSTGAANAKAMSAKYGNTACAQIVKGGGPFIAECSETFVEETLTRIGFLDTSLNSDVEEALNIFSQIARNKRALRKAGIALQETDNIQEKMKSFKSMCFSKEFEGYLQMPTVDTCIRKKLIKEKMITAESSVEAISSAMRHYVKKGGRNPLKTYNGLVWQCSDILTARDPSRRR